jgi:hypothetical protein
MVRGTPEPLLQWVMGRVLNLVGAWRQHRGTIRHLPFVGEERFREAFMELEQGIAALLDAIERIAQKADQKWSREEMAGLAEVAEAAAMVFAVEVGGEERAKVIIDRQLDIDSADRTMAGVDEMAMTFMRNQALEVAGAALAIRVVMTAQPNTLRVTPLSGTERVRRKRERERRGLRFMVPVNVYDGDLDLLRAFGFLAGHQMSDRGAISRVIEAFLATSYLEHAAIKPDLEDRLRAQFGRRQDLTGSKD